MTSEFTGGCLCGKVRYRARGEPVNVRVCHCRLCQKAVGAAFHARLLFKREAVEIDGDVAAFPSSDAIMRGFCPACGTTIYSERASISAIGLSSGSLDDPSLFSPTEHIWVSSKQPWLKLDDGLPQYPEAAPA